MKKKLKKLPHFKNEDEEREFWATHSSTDYFDWSKTVTATFPNLKLSTKTISMRLPEWMITDLKIAANRRDVPYQSLIKIFLAERLKKERQKA